MKVLIKSIILFLVLVPFSQAAQRSTTERTIANNEILESFEQLKIKAADKYAAMPWHEQANARNLYDTTVYTLNLGKHILLRILITTNVELKVQVIFENLLSKIQTNIAFAQMHPELHKELMSLYALAYSQRTTKRSDILTQRDAILLFFDICKDVVRTIGSKWGFDASTALR